MPATHLVRSGFPTDADVESGVRRIDTKENRGLMVALKTYGGRFFIPSSKALRNSAVPAVQPIEGQDGVTSLS